MYFIKNITSKTIQLFHKFKNIYAILIPFYLMFFYSKFNELTSQYYSINSLLSKHFLNYSEIKSNMNNKEKKLFFLDIFEYSFEGLCSTINTKFYEFNETKLFFIRKKFPSNDEFSFLFKFLLLKKGENNNFMLISNIFQIPFNDNRLSQISKYNNLSYYINIPTTILSIIEYKNFKKINSFQILGNLTFDINQLDIYNYNLNGKLNLNNSIINFNLSSDNYNIFKKIFIFGKFLIGIGGIHFVIYLTILDIIKDKDFESIKVKIFIYFFLVLSLFIIWKKLL